MNTLPAVEWTLFIRKALSVDSTFAAFAASFFPCSCCSAAQHNGTLHPFPKCTRQHTGKHSLICKVDKFSVCSTFLAYKQFDSAKFPWAMNCSWRLTFFAILNLSDIVGWFFSCKNRIWFMIFKVSCRVVYVPVKFTRNLLTKNHFVFINEFWKFHGNLVVLLAKKHHMLFVAQEMRPPWPILWSITFLCLYNEFPFWLNSFAFFPVLLLLSSFCHKENEAATRYIGHRRLYK